MTSENPDRPGTGALVARVWAACAPYRRRLVVVVLLEVLATLLVTAQPLVLLVVIDRGLGENDRSALVTCALVLAGTTAAWGGARLAATRAGARLTADLRHDLRHQVFASFQKQGLGFFTVSRPGAMTSAIMADTTAAGTLAVVVPQIAQHVSLIGVTVVTMALIDWRILLGLAVVPLAARPLARLGDRIKSCTDVALRRRRELSSVTVEALGVDGAELVKAYGAQDRLAEAFDEASDRLRHADHDRNVVGMLYPIAIGSAIGIGGAVLIGVGAWTATSGALSAGAVAALVTYLYRLQNPLASLGYAGTLAGEGLTAFERVFELLELPGDDASPRVPDVAARPPRRDRQPCHVSFEDVTFRYRDASELSIPSLAATAAAGERTTDALAGVGPLRFAIPAGTCVGLVGPSGAGKSTAALLLARLYTPTSGRILLDGVDLDDLPEEDLRRAVALVSQTPRLLNASVAENVRLGRAIGDDDVERACRLAQVHDRITALPHGYATLLGESGEHLSGGERQRVAIARALAGDPDVLIFDEATAHLDGPAEANVIAAMHEAMAGRSTLLITHRPSTLRAATAVYVMEEGRVVETCSPGDYEVMYARRQTRVPSVARPVRG